MNDLQIFEYMGNQKVRTVTIDGEAWFVANDVCKVLGIANPWDAISSLDDDEKDDLGITEAIGRTQKTNIINESGLYALIFKSRKPDAKKFKRWVFHEVIPKILRTGTYSLPAKAPAPPFLFHIRARQNQDRVPETYFSVISELVIVLYGKLEMSGYSIAEKDAKGRELRPDISVGKLWITWLNDNHPELAHRYKDYMHLLPNGLEVPARMYELDLLPKFRLFVHDVWIKEHGYKYFMERDPKAIDHLIRLIPDMRIPTPAIEDRQPQLQQR